MEDRDYLEILIKATLPEVESSKARTKRKAPRDRQVPTSLDDVISPNVVCSQDLRAFFQRYLGPGFRFKVEFQAWLRGNAGKTYRDAVEAYPTLKHRSEISPQFEYNQFIPDFFASNKGATFDDAVNGWNRKTIEREDPKDYENDNKNRGDRVVSALWLKVLHQNIAGTSNTFYSVNAPFRFCHCENVRTLSP
ncbi:MAG: hypothetical protein IJK05_07340 [Bacteroidales bacterium]|nr:hypothetical protein [Bacteroidales bacterium]